MHISHFQLAAAVVLASTLNAQAIMLPGAIGNDGSGVFDGSIIASAGTNHSNGRTPEAAIQGLGLTPTGHEGNNEFGDNVNWMSLNSTTSWLKVDLGQSYNLGRALFYNFNTLPGGGGNTDRGVETANIYVHDGAAEPNANNADGSGNSFDSTGWTLFAGDVNFTQAPGGDNYNTPDVINFAGTTARFVAFEATDNYGDGSFVGISEIQFFEAPIPEPSTALLLGSGLIGLVVGQRTRRRTKR